jgi:putative nucleotidyltransferase with HDIG domain
MKLPLFQIPREIRDIAKRLDLLGKKSYVVGGSLRDHFLNRTTSNDFDMASDATPEEISKAFPRVVPTGIKHGTVTILAGKLSVEITTLRTEKAYADGRRPDSVAFVADIGQDLARRDFTMNAMALDPISGDFHDPFEGRKDIRNRLIRTVGDPLERFGEDGLRPLRAVRFASQLGFSIDPDTLSAVKPSLETFKRVSWERIRDEFQKIMLSPQPSIGLRLLESTGMLEIIAPELLPCRGFIQKGMHVFDVLDHLFAAADASLPRLEVRLAALLHDIGKPRTASFDESGTPSFHGHEKVSASMARTFLRRLKFSNEVVEKVLRLIEHHMFNYTEAWTDAAVRRFLARVGPDLLEELFCVRVADSAAILGIAPEPRALNEFRSRIEGLLAGDSALRIKDLALGGEELAAMGVPRGPLMGEILAELLETVLDDPDQNEPERLKIIAENLYRKRMPRG